MEKKNKETTISWFSKQFLVVKSRAKSRAIIAAIQLHSFTIFPFFLFGIPLFSTPSLIALSYCHPPPAAASLLSPFSTSPSFLSLPPSQSRGHAQYAFRYSNIAPAQSLCSSRAAHTTLVGINGDLHQIEIVSNLVRAETGYRVGRGRKMGYKSY